MTEKPPPCFAGRTTMTRRVRYSVMAAVAALAGLVLPLAAQTTPAAAAGPCGPPVVNVIACENTLPGTPASDWQISGSGSATIQGFATAISVQPGDTVQFKINTPSTNYHFDILRLGYYQGNGARKVAAGLRPSVSLPQTQPACRTDSQPTGLIDCGNWGVSASWTVPTTAVSGVYIAHLVRDDASGGSHIVFVVRNDSSHSDIIYQTSDETWQAYNTYGGNSLYTCASNCPPGSPDAYKGASKVSYNRPFHTADDDQGGRSWLMYAEYPMIRFLEANGYDVSYTTGMDVATSTGGSLLTNHKMFMSSGHDEYWTGSQRANVEAARDHGVNLAFFSGNEVFWKTRTEPSIDGTSTPNRTLVCLQGDPLQRRGRPAGPVDLDRDLGGPAVQPTGRWRPAAERADRAVVRGQHRHHRHQGAGAVLQAAVLAEHVGGQPDRGAVGDAGSGRRDAGLRVGH